LLSLRAFADPNESLPYITSVVSTIRTVDEEPIYAKLYLYPMGTTDFVNKEIQNLLKDGINLSKFVKHALGLNTIDTLENKSSVKHQFLRR